MFLIYTRGCKVQIIYLHDFLLATMLMLKSFVDIEIWKNNEFHNMEEHKCIQIMRQSAPEKVKITLHNMHAYMVELQINSSLS